MSDNQTNSNITPGKMRERLNVLYDRFVNALQSKLDSGEATSQDMALAWKVLMDNGVPLLKMAEGVDTGADPEETVDEFTQSLPFKKPQVA